MEKVRIYQPRKAATQSGRSKTKKWLVEFVPRSPQKIDPLMGWAGHGDTRRQIKLHFETKEEAITYCKKIGFDYFITDSKTRGTHPKSYSDNFAHERGKNWTH